LTLYKGTVSPALGGHILLQVTELNVLFKMDVWLVQYGTSTFKAQWIFYSLVVLCIKGNLFIN